MKDKVVFSQQEISCLLPQPVQQDLPAMGVLQKVQWASIRSKTMSYSFSHLSIQELLAAYYIAKMEESEQVKVFQTLLDKPRFSAVLQFYAGFTKLAKQGVQKIITRTDFTHVRSSRHSLLSYMRCLSEEQWQLYQAHNYLSVQLLRVKQPLPQHVYAWRALPLVNQTNGHRDYMLKDLL